MGGKDDFPTMALTKRLVKTGVILGKNKTERGENTVKRANKRRDDSSDDEY